MAPIKPRAHYGSAAVLLAGFGVLIFPVLFPTVVVPDAAAWLTAKREDAPVSQS
ncbi:MAG: hypothetical protein ABWZ02_11160 [Nakamurella sp.]